MTIIPFIPPDNLPEVPAAPAMSRQRRWQIARRAAGLCVKCGQPALPGLGQCAVHNEADKARARESYWHGGDKARKAKAYAKAAKAVKTKRNKPGSINP